MPIRRDSHGRFAGGGGSSGGSRRSATSRRSTVKATATQRANAGHRRTEHKLAMADHSHNQAARVSRVGNRARKAPRARTLGELKTKHQQVVATAAGASIHRGATRGRLAHTTSVRRSYHAGKEVWGKQLKSYPSDRTLKQGAFHPSARRRRGR